MRWMTDLAPDETDGPLAPTDPQRQVIAMVLLGAVNDLRSRSERIRRSAGDWLQGETAERYCDLLGIDVNAMRERLGI